MQQDWQEHQFIHCAQQRHRKIHRLDNEQPQQCHGGEKPAGAILVPEGEPEQAQVEAGDGAP